MLWIIAHYNTALMAPALVRHKEKHGRGLARRQREILALFLFTAHIALTMNNQLQQNAHAVNF